MIFIFKNFKVALSVSFFCDYGGEKRKEMVLANSVIIAVFAVIILSVARINCGYCISHGCISW
jgi:hypothetical protein